MELKKIEKENLEDLYSIIYSSQKPKWTLYNAPYFNDFVFIDKETFMLYENHKFFLSEDVFGIFYNQRIIGTLTRYWEDKKTRWLEIGIVIYDDSLWSQGIGEQALSFWILKCFEDYREIERVGLTSWSGNPGMMRLAEKVGMSLEGRLRKVRYYNGIYYDSVKYGILRDEI